MGTRRAAAEAVLALAVAALIALPPLRRWLEIDMARHMLLEFPALLAIGALLARRLPRAGRAFGRIDRLGLTGWLFASLVLAFWMIPAALDAALASGLADGAKMASLALAGFALAASWQRSSPFIEAFFVGNFAWMTATVGMVYQDSPSQLCLNYLTDSQQRAGVGLVGVAIAIGVAWLAVRYRRLGLAETLDDAPEGATPESRRHGPTRAMPGDAGTR